MINSLSNICVTIQKLVGRHPKKRGTYPERLQGYILYCHQGLGLSENQIHSRINAIKFYFEKVEHREKMFFNIPHPKKPSLLPKSLNTVEVRKLINVTENRKHRLILKLGYGMGLRLSEIVGLKISGIVTLPISWKTVQI